jgi:transposase
MGRPPRYVVRLSGEEQSRVRELTRTGQVAARTLTRAHLVLVSDEGMTDARIAATLHIGLSTVVRTRRRYCTSGLDAALSERPRPGGTPTLDAQQEAVLIALACSTPPEERGTWTMQLLADRLVTLGGWRPSRTRRCAGPCKKRAQALAAPGVVSPRRRQRLRLAPGGCPGAVCRARRPPPPAGLLRRVSVPIARRGAPTSATAARPSGAAG